MAKQLEGSPLFHTLRLRLVSAEQALQGEAKLPEEEGDPVDRELSQIRLLGPAYKNYAPSALLRRCTDGDRMAFAAVWL